MKISHFLSYSLWNSKTFWGLERLKVCLLGLFQLGSDIPSSEPLQSVRTSGLIFLKLANKSVVHGIWSCQLSQLKRHLWYEPHRQCPISKCDGSRCLSSTSSILKSLAPSGLFFHCFCLNSLTTALSKHLTNPFLVASTLALHQNREMLDPDKFCSLCHSTFNNPVMAQQHYMGKKHRKQETKLRLMAHYGRLADPAVSDLPGERARLIHKSWTRDWALELPGWPKCVLLPASSKAGFANTEGNQEARFGVHSNT